MLQSLKRFWLVLALLLAGGRSMYGFALIGPIEANWQLPALGFNLAGDDGGPKDLGDGYRMNARTLYYASDASFAHFFGTNGLLELDKAFAVFNNLTNLSSYSHDLTEWPLTTSRFNYTAEALNLVDMKSMAMSRIVSLLGLAQPDRYVWNIHDRFNPFPNIPCPPGENYVVVQRNFDPVTYEYSSYINGVLYDYAIVEGCTTAPIVAIAQEFAVDPTVVGVTAVASGVDAFRGAVSVSPGRFYTGLTRDDVGGLRYLMSTNQVNVEPVAPNVALVSTNSDFSLLVTLDLALFQTQARFNNSNALLALYPNLVITSTINAFTNVVTTTFTATLVRPPLSPAGTLQLVLVPTFTTNVAPIFYHTFANVFVVHSSPQSVTTTTTTGFTAPPGAPAGFVQFTTNTTTSVVNTTNGDFYILPANLCAPYQILATQLVTQVFTTNVLATVFTNGRAFTASSITSFNQYSLLVHQVDCVSNSVAVLEGLDKINFVRTSFDSVVGTNWTPVTNFYNLTAVINGAPVTQTYRRVVTQPDILIEAKDIIQGPGNGTIAFALVVGGNSLNYNNSQQSSDGFGPGTIQPPTTLIFGKGGGPIFQNNGGFFQTQATATPYFRWGSFDGSTNAPIAYPDGTSLAGLINQILSFQISATLLPVYSVSSFSAAHPYGAQLNAVLGTPPYTWSLATNSPGLPPGLSLSATGMISGVSSASAGNVYDFIVQAVDSSSPANTNQASIFIEFAP